MQHTMTEKKIAKAVLDIMSKAIGKAMATIDAHEGRYMKKELKLEDALLEPTHKHKRRYVHTAAFWRKKKAQWTSSHSKRTYTKKNKKYWGL
jgi:hypothetical protein